MRSLGLIDGGYRSHQRCADPPANDTVTYRSITSNLDGVAKSTDRKQLTAQHLIYRSQLLTQVSVPTTVADPSLACEAALTSCCAVLGVPGCAVG